ncbi:hypothetical protein OR16_24740 [Cupriavidus basilensis OR16]|uniref:Uncharacterized protein n=1 Tax=Cupriavidus basilensis OR16 TaxID=1127483 RepID=H1SA29_9BURK|nr:hypothetical protein [Cupriavidus basilensis]EHP40578.1 hypothetical protein OR16_24740 [Cupriavidus basilensis OR16]
MFIVLLKFSDNKHRAAEFMAPHKAWIHGVFLMVGSLQPNLSGGAQVWRQVRHFSAAVNAPRR